MSEAPAFSSSPSAANSSLGRVSVLSLTSLLQAVVDCTVQPLAAHWSSCRLSLCWSINCQYHYQLVRVSFVQAGLEKRLQRTREIEAYNEALQDFLNQGTLHEVPEDEMASWKGPVNYICHHGVAKPGSVTTALRVVSNSSLDNKNSGLSYNILLPKVGMPCYLSSRPWYPGEATSTQLSWILPRPTTP